MLSEDIKGAVVGFIILLTKGLLDDERWDWDVEKENYWEDVKEGVMDPTILRTTISVFLNTLRIDESGKVLNYQDAKFRGFQYFRMLLGHEGYQGQEFTSSELEEPAWWIWES